MSTMSELDITVRELRAAGFAVRHAARPADPGDGLSWMDLADHPAEGTEPFIDLAMIAVLSDYVTTVDRSNYRSLLRDYPDTFCPTSYADSDVLGIFASDTTDALLSLLIRLRTEYPLYDEDDHSMLEMEEISDSFAAYAGADVASLLPELPRRLWDELPADEQEDLFWEVVQASDLIPEHDGRDVLWKYSDVSAALAEALAPGSAGCRLCRRLGHPLSEPCQP